MAIVPTAALIVDYKDDDNRYSSHKIFWILLGIIFSIIFIFFSSRLFVRYLLHRSNLRQRAAAAITASQEPEAAAVIAVGMDDRVIASLPTFAFRKQAGDGGGLCAVCLCAVKESEVMRVLPNCKHFFHVECIGSWLRSHPTCPVCRADTRLRLAAGRERVGRGGWGRSAEEGSSTPGAGKVAELEHADGDRALDSEKL